MSAIDAPFGLWFNKRQITTLGFLFQHGVDPSGAGWRLDVKGKGQLVIHFERGSADTLELEPGDFILGSGDDLFVKLQRAPAKVPPARGA